MLPFIFILTLLIHLPIFSTYTSSLDPLCTVEYPDVQSKAIQSPYVILGVIIMEKKTITNDIYYHNATVEVQSIIKTKNSKLTENLLNNNYLIGPFTIFMKDYRSCVGMVTTKREYIFYLKDINILEKFLINLFPPDESNSLHRAQLDNVLCDQCASAPIIITPFVNQTLREDFYVTQVCSVKSVPEPRIVWKKNGILLEVGLLPGLSLTAARGSVTLRKNYLMITDEGFYECEAQNILGKISKGFQLSVRRHELNNNLLVTPPPITACDSSMNGYCLNGGTCYNIRGNYRDSFCRCTSDFIGNRCQLYNIDDIIEEKKVTTAGNGSKCFSTPYFILGVILVGVAIAILVIVMIAYWNCVKQYSKLPSKEPLNNTSHAKSIQVNEVGQSNVGGIKRRTDSIDSRIPFLTTPEPGGWSFVGGEIPKELQQSTTGADGVGWSPNTHLRTGQSPPPPPSPIVGFINSPNNRMMPNNVNDDGGGGYPRRTQIINGSTLPLRPLMSQQGSRQNLLTPSGAGAIPPPSPYTYRG